MIERWLLSLPERQFWLALCALMLIGFTAIMAALIAALAVIFLR